MKRKILTFLLCFLLVGLPTYAASEAYSAEARVAVIDSGIFEHQELTTNILQGHNYVDNSDDTTDNIGHGTYVSGIITADCDNTYITGISHQVKIVPLKCFDVNVETTTQMIVNAIYDAVDVYDCDVINLSIGIPEGLITDSLQASIEYAIEKNCIVVASVGNCGNTDEFYPAKYENVVGVGSVGKDYKLSSFSQRNTTVDVVALGEETESISVKGFLLDSGTSFSTSHVSAIAAIAKCINKDMTAQEFDALLKRTSTIPDSDKINSVYYGYGVLNAEKILTEMLKNTPYSVEIGEKANEQEKTYNNLPFKDINITDWYYETVKMAYEKSVIKGVSETEFAPNLELTRAMFVTILYRLDGEPAVNKGVPFADVKANEYFANAVIWGQQSGIISGVTETEFAPNANITREQMATILYRYAKYKAYDVSVGEDTNILSYDDAFDVSEYAYPALQWTCGAGLINGRTESTLNPQDNATRAETAAILARFIEGNVK